MPTVSKRATIERLREGPVFLGRGITIAAVMNEKDQITFIKFTHPTKDGTCTKILPIKKGKMKYSYANGFGKYELGWRMKVKRGKNKYISLSPSVLCSQHRVHGFISEGRWRTYDFFDLSQAVMERRIEAAIKDAEQYGGGYWGAILSMASKKY